jgi:hypothetical protein
LGFLDTQCTFKQFSPELITSCQPFDCGHKDLNDFFTNDCINYSNQLLGKTYCFTLDTNPNIVICLFTISNDSIKVNLLSSTRKNRINRRIPNPKRMRSYPAVLIGRLGVNNEYQQRGIGDEVMDFIKSWFIDEKNKTGCRFIVVDSYNEPIPLKYYLSNNFEYMFENESDERKYSGFKKNKSPLLTRLMCFDLIVLKK